MKNFKYTIIALILCFSSTYAKAQIISTIDEFTNRIDAYVVDVNKKISDATIEKSSNGRKILISGTLDNQSKLFYRKIQYYRNGIKKETIQILEVFGPNNKPIQLEIIIINDQYFYIKNNTFSANNTIILEETLIEGKIFVRVEKDSKRGPNKLLWDVKAK